jgi:hypothetical protein
VAEPWTDDLAALGNHSKTGLRSIAHMRAECTRRESRPKMRFFKQHPALAVLLVLVFLGVAAPVAYAIYDRVFVSIDMSQTADEIEADVKDQLAAHGKSGTVTATKTDHSYEVAIASEDPTMGKLDLEVAAPDGKKHQLHFDIPACLPEAQQRAIGDAASAVLQQAGNGKSDAAYEKEIRDDLNKAGLRDFDVRVRGTSITIVARC